LHHVEHLIAD
jgi:hypothetical protein